MGTLGDAVAELSPVGVVRSSLADPGAAPKQGDEGAPEATLEIAPRFEPALSGLVADEDLLVLTWLDRADRDVLLVHPRGDSSNPPTGVFATRSPARPNPIGLHRVRLLAVAGRSLRVAGLEAVDGTPVLDLKPVLGPVEER